MSGDYTDKTITAISKWLVLFFGLSWWPLDEVGTAFANDIMYTIPADDRSRKFALITIWNPAVILPLIYGLQVPSKVRQQPIQLSHSIPIWISFCALVFLLIICYDFLFCV